MDNRQRYNKVMILDFAILAACVGMGTLLGVVLGADRGVSVPIGVGAGLLVGNVLLFARMKASVRAASEYQVDALSNASTFWRGVASIGGVSADENQIWRQYIVRAVVMAFAGLLFILLGLSTAHSPRPHAASAEVNASPIPEKP